MYFTSPSLKMLLSYGIFIAVLLARPNGLFSRAEASRPPFLFGARRRPPVAALAASDFFSRSR